MLRGLLRILPRRGELPLRIWVRESILYEPVNQRDADPVLDAYRLPVEPLRLVVVAAFVGDIPEVE